jgi:hypothetical protein
MSQAEGTPQPSTSSLPPQLPPQQIRNSFFTITPNDIQTLIQGVQDRPAGEKELKYAEQSPFSGKPEDLDPMLREAEIRFGIQRNTYNTATKKAYYILSLFKSGNAKLWKEQYLRARESKTLTEGDSWTEFRKLLKDSFKDVGSKDDAIAQLQRIRQKPGQSIDEFNTRFRILVQIGGLDEEENATLLTEFYSRAIKTDIAKRIILQEAPETLSGWMKKAAQVDSFERRANQFFAERLNVHKKKDKTTWKPRFYTPNIEMKEDQWRSTGYILKKNSEGKNKTFASPVESQATERLTIKKEDHNTRETTKGKHPNTTTEEGTSKEIDRVESPRNKYERSKTTTIKRNERGTQSERSSPTAMKIKSLKTT